ncbi:MAG: hypothetical protein HDS03_10300 [Bacteroides sp.]|nr:hypothetical protein [Bacteroides sp.]
MIKKKSIGVALALAAICSSSLEAHTVPKPVTPEDLDTIREKVSALSRVHLGGYGEAAYNYNFSTTRVSYADALYEDSRGHGSLDIPRIVLMLGVNLGKGWGVETDVQFENCKNVSIDQFWIEKLFRPEAGLRAGYLTLPVGAVNAHDDPLEFFTVNRPSDEDDILPCDWHQAGLSFYGSAGSWDYEAILIPGINTSLFSEDEWLALGATGESFDFSRGHDLAVVGRVDNNSIEGLRLSLSGYYGVSYNNRLAFHNGLLQKIKGNVGFLSFDFLYDDYSWILRGNGSWGRYSKNINSSGRVEGVNEHTSGAKSAFAAWFEGGYDMFNLGSIRESGQKLYLFGRYDYWQPFEQSDSFLGYDWGHRQRVGAGLNYFPIDKVVVKAEYSHTFLPGGKGIPMLSLGVAYSGQFF